MNDPEQKELMQLQLLKARDLNNLKNGRMTSGHLQSVEADPFATTGRKANKKRQRQLVLEERP